MHTWKVTVLLRIQQVTLNFEMNLGRYINQLTYWHALMWISSARSITGLALNCQHCTLIHPLTTENSLPMTQVLSSCNKHFKQGKIKPTVQQWQDITMMQFSLAWTALRGTSVCMLFMGGKAMYVLWMTNKLAQSNHFIFRFWGHKGSDENIWKIGFPTPVVGDIQVLGLVSVRGWLGYKFGKMCDGMQHSQVIRWRILVSPSMFMFYIINILFLYYILHTNIVSSAETDAPPSACHIILCLWAANHHIAENARQKEW